MNQLKVIELIFISVFIFAPFIFAMDNLEDQYIAYWKVNKLDIADNYSWDTFLIKANEKNPHDLASLLNEINSGVVITTGSQRAFFLIAAIPDVTKVDGIVIIDINPKVKYFADFNILLLRIAKDRKDYEHLRNGDVGIDTIKDRLEKSNIPINAKNYYLDNLNDLATVFYSVELIGKSDMDEYYEKVRYDQNEDLFTKVRNYARAGNIIAVTRDINKVEFLSKRNIAAIDASNIHDYVPIAFRGGSENPLKTTVIYTVLSNLHTDYKSFIYSELPREEIKEFKQLVKFCQACSDYWTFVDLDWFKSSNNLIPDETKLPPSISSKDTLLWLRKYCKERILTVKNVIVCDMGLDWVDKFNDLTEDDLKTVVNCPETRQFMKEIVAGWAVLQPKVYCAFMEMDGWKEQFEDFFSSRKGNLKSFLSVLDRNGLLISFADKFGNTRLNKLKSREN